MLSESPKQSPGIAELLQLAESPEHSPGIARLLVWIASQVFVSKHELFFGENFVQSQGHHGLRCNPCGLQPTAP